MGVYLYLPFYSTADLSLTLTLSTKENWEPVYLGNSKGENKLYAPADYIQITLENEIGIFTIQFVQKDSAGEEVTRICDINDSQIGHVKPLLREIEFVHEVYFSNLGPTGHKLVIGYDVSPSR